MTEFLLLDICLLALAVLTAIAAVESRNLFSAAMLTAIYGLLLALVWVNMDAADVAFTEAAVGAGITTILLIGTLVLVGHHETVRKAVHWPALLAVLLTGAALTYGTLDMPRFGSAQGPVHTHPIAEAFTEQDLAKDPQGKSGVEAAAREAAERRRRGALAGHAGEHEDYFHGHVPNQVTAVIVSYRAMDTLMEAAVIFAAGLSMILLLRGRRGLPWKGGLL
jgi:multicomponent Na+:H+ antiporter subunit B